MSTIKKLLDRGLFHIFGTSVLNKIISFASGIVLVRLLTKADYGSYAYAYNIFSMFLLFSGAGASSAVLQLCSETDSVREQRNIYSYGYYFGLRINVVLCIGILVTSLLVSLPVEGSNFILALLFLFPMVVFINEIQVVIMRTELRNRDYAWSSNINTILIFIGSVLGAFSLGANGLVAGRYIAMIATIAIIVHFFNAPIVVRKGNADDFDKKAFRRIALLSALNNGISQLTYLIGTFAIGMILNDQYLVAGYQAATVIPTALNFIPTALVAFIYPYFARNRHDRCWILKNFTKVVSVMLLLSLFVAFVLIIAADSLIPFIFGAEYVDSIVPFKILMVGFVFSGAFRVIAGNLLITQRKLTFNSVNAVFSLVALCFMNALLIPVWGTTGAAVSQAVVMFLTGSASVVYFVKSTNRQV